MKVSKLYLFLFVAVGITIAATTSSVFGAGTLTNMLANPANTLSDKGTQYAIEFTTATPGNISKVTVDFPAGTNISVARVIDANNIGEGTTTFSGTTLTYTITSPQSVPGGTKIFLFVAKVKNALVTGNAPQTLSITTFDGATAIDGPTTAPFALQSQGFPTMTIDQINVKVGINNTSPQNTLDVNGNIGVSQNIKSTGTSGSTLKIIPAASGDICIGSGC